jgi:outer membrane cobalamin receptor
MDVLALVPGFDFGVDINGVTGVAFRGIWGHEGKILLLWDGVEMNETLFGNLPLGNHYPVDQIKRVEIIRGPGSAMYGGFAEVAVVKVTTLGAADFQGLAGSLAYGRGGGATLHAQANALFGWTGDGTEITLGAFGGSGDRSGQDYTDATGLSYSMAGNGSNKPFLVNLGVRHGGLQFRAIVDQYQNSERDNFGVSTPGPVTQRFISNALDLRYEWKVSEHFILTPYAVYRDQKPWWIEDVAPQVNTLMDHATRTRAGIQAAWEPAERWDVQFGYEFTRDEGQADAGNSIPFNSFVHGATTIAYNDSAFFGQMQYQGPVNVTLGARFEDHSAAGTAFVPRFALTKVLGKWHFKALAAQSFRTPSILNINNPLYPGGSIEPEKTTSYELEAGRQIGTGVLSVNLFSMKVNKPLVFTVLDITQQGYFNQGSITSKGIEAQYQVRATWGFLNASLGTRSMDNQVDAWSVPGEAHASLGFPSIHGALQACIRWGGYWSLNPSLRYLGSRKGYTYGAANGGMELVERSADTVLDCNVAYSRGPVTASLGLFDITDRAVPFIQPYNGGHPFLPGSGRELFARLKYGF